MGVFWKSGLRVYPGIDGRNDVAQMVWMDSSRCRSIDLPKAHCKKTRGGPDRFLLIAHQTGTSIPILSIDESWRPTTFIWCTIELVGCDAHLVRTQDQQLSGLMPRRHSASAIKNKTTLEQFYLDRHFHRKTDHACTGSRQTPSFKSLDHKMDHSWDARYSSRGSQIWSLLANEWRGSSTLRWKPNTDQPYKLFAFHKLQVVWPRITETTSRNWKSMRGIRWSIRNSEMRCLQEGTRRWACRTAEKRKTMVS